MAKTNSGLVAYAKAQVGLPYWYGTYGQTASASLYESKKEQYPSYYTATDFVKQYGKRVHDCVGLVKGYLWSDSTTAKPSYKSAQDKSASGMYAASSEKGKINTFPKHAGQLVYKGTTEAKIHHVGVYDGNGYVYEAKGHAYGVVETKFEASEWDFWSQCPYCTDDSENEDDDEKDNNSYVSATFAAGIKITLKSVKLYASSSASSVSGTKTGTFYIWSAKIVNNRIRITNSASNVGKTDKITGWVNVSDISGSSTSSSTKTYAVGDKVVVTGTIYANANGTGATVKLSKATRYVVNVESSTKYKNPIGVAKTKGGARQGWASTSILS